eukprot:gnl/TRDRNA2_/TRDRNA2_91714_c0_seq1.p1 gnl/TRDRNA2_/TRDRNA2_91714_c0~~gnl/TRDRNA2_/TRDRNA2_91714_c0_seq1.p1  ORF type:complete len:339 (-),score=85.86 gnl/TRDRNA2_/TRDRNA2_91714_c0_seq1:25-891(-)
MACMLALYKTLITIFPFGVVLLIFMGLREVAINLADPFGQDEVDFPISMFLTYTFEHAVCLLEAFNRMERKDLLKTIDTTAGFTDRQLTMAVDKHLLYKQAGIQRNNHFDWENTAPLRDTDNDGVVAQLHTLLKLKEKRDDAPELEEPELDVQKQQEEEMLKLPTGDAAQAMLSELLRESASLQKEIRMVNKDIRRLEHMKLNPPKPEKHKEKAPTAPTNKKDAPVGLYREDIPPVPRPLPPSNDDGAEEDDNNGVLNFHDAQAVIRDRLEMAGAGRAMSSMKDRNKY